MTYNIALSAAAGQPATMSSREIAEFVGTTHDSVLKTVRNLIEKGVVFENETPYVHEQNGQTYSEFLLSYRNTMVVVSGYSVEVRARIIDRWQELEQEKGFKKKAELPQDYISALEHLLESKKAEQLAIAQRNVAIATKAEIGHRREATAMNTASQAVKKANALEVELDKSKEYATIKRMEMKYHGTKFNWRLLKSTGQEMGVGATEVFDQNYGTVKAYHRSVWMEAYALSIGDDQ